MHQLQSLFFFWEISAIASPAEMKETIVIVFMDTGIRPMAEIMATADIIIRAIIIGTLLRRLILIPITEAVKLKEILDKPRTIPLTSMIAKGRSKGT